MQINELMPSSWNLVCHNSHFAHLSLKSRGFGVWQTLIWVLVLPFSRSETLVKSNQLFSISVSLSLKWVLCVKIKGYYAWGECPVHSKVLYIITSIHKAGRWLHTGSSGRRRIWICNSLLESFRPLYICFLMCSLCSCPSSPYLMV